MPRRRRLPGLLLAAMLAGACSAGSPSGTPSASPSARPTPAAPSASPSPPPARTVIGVLGDFGVDAVPVRRVVAAMARFDGGRPLAAVVTTGDNAYQRGTPSQAAFARRVLAPLLGRGTRLLASLGNHDVATDRGRPVMRAFGMPARWYTAVVGPVELVVLDANRPLDRDQLAFLDRTLAARRTPFRVAVFHQPPVSCSAHRPEPRVVEHWVPRFAGRVDLVLAGHNHTYERFGRPGARPAYVTTGGGGAHIYPSTRVGCRGVAPVVFFRAVHHAVRLVATRESLLVEAVDTNSAVFDRLRLPAS